MSESIPKDWEEIQRVRNFFREAQYQFPYIIRKEQDGYLSLVPRESLNILHYISQDIPTISLGESVDLTDLFPIQSEKRFVAQRRSSAGTKHMKPIYYGQVNGIDIVLKIQDIVDYSRGIALAMPEAKSELEKEIIAQEEAINTELFKETSFYGFSFTLKSVSRLFQGFLRQYVPVDIHEYNVDDLRQQLQQWFERGNVDKVSNSYKLLSTEQKVVIHRFILTHIDALYQHFILWVLAFMIDSIIEGKFYGQVSSRNDWSFIQCSNPFIEVTSTKDASDLNENNVCPFFAQLYVTLLAKRRTDSLDIQDFFSRLQYVVAQLWNEDNIPFNMSEGEWIQMSIKLFGSYMFPFVQKYICSQIMIEEHVPYTMTNEQEKLQQLIKESSTVEKSVFYCTTFTQFQKSLLTQFLIAIYALALKFGFTHADIHEENLLLNRVHSNTIYLFKIREGNVYRYYMLPLKDFELKIIDFGIVAKISEQNSNPCLEKFAFRGTTIGNEISNALRVLRSNMQRNWPVQCGNVELETADKLFRETQNILLGNDILSLETIPSIFPFLMEEISQKTFLFTTTLHTFKYTIE